MHPSLVNCGGATPSAVGRFADYITNNHVKGNVPIPPSPFVEYVADLICGQDRKDYSFGVVGKKGAGKSRTALAIAEKISVEVSKRLGGTPIDYFNPKLNVLTLDDVDAVARRLSELPKHSIILVDDAGVTASNRSSMTIANRNLLAISTVMRTKRCCAIYTMVSAGTIDVGIRNLLDSKVYIYKSCHAAGFNICKVLQDNTTIYGKQYTSRLSVGKKKIDFWAVFSPSPEIVDAYEKEREASADRLIARTVLNGRFDKKTKAPAAQTLSKSEVADNNRLVAVGEKMKAYMAEHPKASINELCSVSGFHYTVTGRLVKKIKDGLS